MTRSSWSKATIGAALVALVGAGLVLGQAHEHPAEKVAQPAATPVRESPYAQYARKHARTAEKVPSRVRPSSSTVHGARGGARVSHP
jgi:hypothetical protein